MEKNHITITRGSRFWGSAKTFTVEIDGIVAGKLSNGGCLRAYVSDGVHNIAFLSFGKISKSVSVFIDSECPETEVFAAINAWGTLEVTIEQNQSESYESDRFENSPRRRRSNPALAVASAVLCLFLLFCLFRLIMDSPPASNEATAEESSSVSSVSAKKKAEEQPMLVSARDLYAAYNENEINADGIYKNKLLSVSGTISDIGRDTITDVPCICLDSGGEYGLYPIQCYFSKSDDENDNLKNLRVGQEITISGECNGVFVYHVQLSSCRIE